MLVKAVANNKSIDNLRDCVKQAFLNGCERGHEFRKMRHAIIVELKRLGYDSSEIKDKLLEWNERCEKPLGISEQKNQLLRYVDWADKRECKIGCKGLEDYCLGKEICQFHERNTRSKMQKMQDLPFDMAVLDKFLSDRFKKDGYVMMLTIKAIRHFQVEKITGETIYVGYRKISSIIRDKFGHTLSPMEILRKMKLLADEGIIEQISKGKSGNFSWQANGYRFKQWEAPKQAPKVKENAISTHNHSYV